MAVITSPKDQQYPLHREMHCSVCEERIRWVPFVVWWTREGLYFCSDCCQRMVDGLAADLIQVDAIRKINRLGYQRITLHREGEEENDERRRQEEKRQHEEIMTSIHLLKK